MTSAAAESPFLTDFPATSDKAGRFAMAAHM